MKLNKCFATIAAAVSILASGGASAAVFPDFDVTPGATNQGALSTFTADKMTGNYTEIISFDGAGNFAVSLRWNAGQFVGDDGNTPLDPSDTGLGFNYGLYAFFMGVGTVTPSGGGVVFTLTAGHMDVYLDDKAPNTGYVTPANGTVAWTTSGVTGADDKLLGSGDVLYGSGNLNTSCSGGINCGSFGQTTNFTLTNDGKSFFTAPDPFYKLTFASGQLNSFALTGTQQINGSLDVVFAVPEPGSLALAGLALLGLGVARRRKA